VISSAISEEVKLDKNLGSAHFVITDLNLS
jgi:hypothetical protein